MIADHLGEWAAVCATTALLLGYTCSRGRALIGLILLISWALRCGLIFYQTHFSWAPESERDTFLFDQTAQLWSTGGLSNALDFFTTGRMLYGWIVAVIYALLGNNLFWPLFLNTLAGVWTVYIVYRTALLFCHSRGALIASLITGLFPTMIFYSGILLRESFVIFFSCLSFHYFVVYMKSNRLMSLVGAFSWMTTAAVLHTGYLLGLLSLALLFATQPVWRSRMGGRALMVNFILGLLLAGTLITGLVISGIGSEKTGGNFIDIFTLDTIVAKQASRDADNRAAYLVGMQPTSIQDLPWQAGLRLVYFLYAPFPWMISSLTDLAGFILTVPWYFFLILYLIRFRNIWKYEAIRALSLCLILFLAIFAMGTTNYGAAARHRNKFIPMAALIMAPIFSPSRKSRDFKSRNPVGYPHGTQDP